MRQRQEHLSRHQVVIDLENDQVKHLGHAMNVRGLQQAIAMNYQRHSTMFIMRKPDMKPPQFDLYGIIDR